MLRVPAIQALLIQCMSFLTALLIMVVIGMLTGIQMAVTAVALLQGIIAAAISRWRCLAPWWLFIQFLFPIALIAMHSLALPSWIFLAAFVLLVGLYWTTFRTQVPFYPSSPAAWDAVADLLPCGRPIRFIDIGSGLGGLILELAKRRPESDFIGIEVAPLPWVISALRARTRHSSGHFIRGDYGRLDFASYDVVFAYLSPAAMPALWEKANAEMRSGSLLLSYEFPIPDVKPHLTTTLEPGAPLLYGWYF